MLKLDKYILIVSDIDAGGGATLDLYFDPKEGLVLEDKTLADNAHLYAEVPIDEAIEDMPYEQVIAIAEAVLCHCSRENEDRPLSEANKQAFDKLVAEIHYPTHDLPEIKEAIVDYYS
jgi:hypothetical protein